MHKGPLFRHPDPIQYHASLRGRIHLCFGLIPMLVKIFEPFDGKLCHALDDMSQIRHLPNRHKIPDTRYPITDRKAIFSLRVQMNVFVIEVDLVAYNVLEEFQDGAHEELLDVLR